MKLAMEEGVHREYNDSGSICQRKVCNGRCSVRNLILLVVALVVVIVVVVVVAVYVDGGEVFKGLNAAGRGGGGGTVG